MLKTVVLNVETMIHELFMDISHTHTTHTQRERERERERVRQGGKPGISGD